MVGKWPEVCIGLVGAGKLRFYMTLHAWEDAIEIAKQHGWESRYPVDGLLGMTINEEDARGLAAAISLWVEKDDRFENVDETLLNMVSLSRFCYCGAFTTKPIRSDMADLVESIMILQRNYMWPAGSPPLDGDNLDPTDKSASDNASRVAVAFMDAANLTSDERVFAHAAGSKITDGLMQLWSAERHQNGKNLRGWVVVKATLKSALAAAAGFRHILDAKQQKMN